LPFTGVEGVAQAISEQVKAEDGEHDEEAGIEYEPGG
jgi:hypothetical protein